MTEGLKITLDGHSWVKLARGFSALFWGMPLALLVCVRSAAATWMNAHEALYPMASLGLICYGIWQLDSLPGLSESRPRLMVNLAKITAATCLGMSPFIFFWNHFPDEPFFNHALAALAFFALVFLLFYNRVIKHLTEILSDQELVSEILFFTRLNQTALIVLACGTALLAVLKFASPEATFLLPENNLFYPLGRFLGLIFLLIPLSLTMSLTWKIKEVFLYGAAEAKTSPGNPSS